VHIISSSAPDSCVRIWDAVLGFQVYTIALPADDAPRMTLAPSGNHFAVGFWNNVIGLWRAALPDEDSSVQARQDDKVWKMTFSPDATQLASCAGRRIRIWDVQRGVEAIAPLEGHEDMVITAAFSPGGSLIATGSRDHTIRLWDVTSGVQALAPLRGHDKEVRSLAFSPDGQHIVSGSLDATLRLWSVVSGDQITSPWKTRDGINASESITFSGDGRRVVSCQIFAGNIFVWDTISGMEILRLSVRRWDSLRLVTLSIDAQYIFAARSPTSTLLHPWIPSNQGVRIWDSSGACIVKNRNYLHEASAINDPIIITPDFWIVDTITQRVIGKLPSTVSLNKCVSSQTSVAFTTTDKPLTIFIIHFPLTTLTNPGTWDISDYDEDTVSSESDEYTTDTDSDT